MTPEQIKSLADWIRHMHENGMTLAHVPEMREHLNNLKNWELWVISQHAAAQEEALTNDVRQKLEASLKRWDSYGGFDTWEKTADKANEMAEAIRAALSSQKQE